MIGNGKARSSDMLASTLCMVLITIILVASGGVNANAIGTKTVLGGNTYTYNITLPIKVLTKAELCISVDAEPFECHVVYDPNATPSTAFTITSLSNLTKPYSMLASVNYLYSEILSQNGREIVPMSKKDGTTFPDPEKVYQEYYRIQYISLETYRREMTATETIDVVYNLQKLDLGDRIISINNTYSGIISPFGLTSNIPTEITICTWNVSTENAFLSAPNATNVFPNPASYISFFVGAMTPYPSTNMACFEGSTASGPLVFLGSARGDQMTNMIMASRFQCIFTSSNTIDLPSILFEPFYVDYAGKTLNEFGLADSGVFWKDSPSGEVPVTKNLEFYPIIMSIDALRTNYAEKHVFYNMTDPHQKDQGAYVVAIVCQSLEELGVAACTLNSDSKGNLDIIGPGVIINERLWITSWSNLSDVLGSSIEDLPFEPTKITYKFSEDDINIDWRDLRLRVLLYVWYDDGQLRFLGGSSSFYFVDTDDSYFAAVVTLACLFGASIIVITILSIMFCKVKKVCCMNPSRAAKKRKQHEKALDGTMPSEMDSSLDALNSSHTESSNHSSAEAQNNEEPIIHFE